MPAPRPIGRPRTTDLREVVNALLYMGATGCQWAMLPKDCAEPSEAAPAAEATIEIGVSGGRCLRVPASLPTSELRRLIRAVKSA